MKKLLFLIRPIREKEFVSLIKIYQKAFPKHNIFQQKPKEILKYLQQTQGKHKAAGGGYLAAAVNYTVVGGILVRKEAEDFSGKHSLWRLNHLAVAPQYQRQGIGTALLQATEKKILAAVRTGKMRSVKIEIGVAENEKIAVEFYRKNGFKMEGKLRSHYRFNEKVYIMGKEIKL